MFRAPGGLSYHHGGISHQELIVPVIGLRIPIENKRNFFDVSGDVLEKVDPIFYRDIRSATFKALGL